jgi:predicted outer membrane protein
MDRRTILLAAVATATAVPAFGQTNTTPEIGEAEKTHDTKTAMFGGASLQMANIALEKAANEKVKEFAKFEHDEQTTVGEVLNSMDPSLSPPSPPADVAEAIDKLKKLNGAAFDREFISAQIQGHEMLRSIQQDYLKIGKDPQTINATKLVVVVIDEHLALLRDLRRMA